MPGVEAVAVGVAADAGGEGNATLPVSALMTTMTLSAGGKKAAVRSVYGQRGGAFAGRQRPGALDGQGLGIEGEQGALVFEVDEHRALAVGEGLFGLAAARSTVPTTCPVVASMAVAFLPRPFMVKTRLVCGS